jgi:hypothetical protein
MKAPTPELSSSTQALLGEERAISAQDEAVRSRLVSRAHEAVRLGPPAPHVLGVPRASMTKLFVAVAAGLALVGGIAASVYLLRGTEPNVPGAAPAVPTPAVATASSASAPIARAEALPPPEAPATDRAPEQAPTPNARPATSSGRGGALEELQLLSRARKADARGDFSEVLALASEHQRSFPAGRLAEERDVLRVRALVGLGRTEQARRAAARFRRQFPRSVLLHKVDEMVPSLP